LIKYILSYNVLKEVYHWFIITKGDHGVYSKVVFQPISHPLAWMDIRSERPKDSSNIAKEFSMLLIIMAPHLRSLHNNLISFK